MIKSFALLAVMSVLATACGRAPESAGEAGGHTTWFTDFSEAKRLAAERDVPILANFSGSDWCHRCIRLDKEVFSRKAFAEYAQSNLVLFVADFPRREALPADLQQQNERLARAFGVQGFPTVLLLDASGTAFAQTGYRRGGPDTYVEHLKGLIARSDS